MRTAGIALFVALFFGCAKEEPLVPLLHMRASDEEFAREGAAAIKGAGVSVRLAPVAELDAEEIPDWVNAADGGWLVMGKAEDKKRAEQALEAWYEELRRRSSKPKPLPEPLRLGARRAVDGKEVAAIQAELTRRRSLDQVVRKDARRRKEMARVDADNTKYIKGLVTDVGWIDAERFGRAAAGAAFLIVQHSGDLPLMLAALPEIEKDVRARLADAQNFALLYDRTQLLIDGKQRYGSQVREKQDGRLVVAGLEDPDRVDEFRKALGLEPLRDYLARFGGEVEIER